MSFHSQHRWLAAASLAAGLSWSLAQAQEARFVRGDANDDGNVGVADIIANLGSLFLGRATSCYDSLDVNDDGSADVGDPVHLIIALFIGAGSIPEPYPRCGRDPTATDSLDCRASSICDCLDEAALQAMVAEQTSDEVCIPSPALETSILGNQIIVCPLGRSQCADGSDGCRLVFTEVGSDIDLVRSEIALHLVGDVNPLFVDIDPLVGANQTCNYKVEFDGVVRGPISLRARSDGNFDFVELGPAILDERETSIIFTSNIPATGFCATLLNLQGSLVSTIIAELQPSIDEVVAGVNRDLQGTVVCKAGR